jgi:hypothetical protein
MTAITYMEISNFELDQDFVFTSDLNFLDALKQLILEIKAEFSDYSIQITETEDYIEIYFLDLEDFEYTQNYYKIKKQNAETIFKKYI